MQNDSVRLNSSPENTTPDRRVDIVSGEIDSRELFQGDREIRIRHGADIYRLRLTGLNRLILTK
jgi:hemin uptake protein HemP